MSGVTDSLLAATTIAIEKNVDAAIASLGETFRRHEATAKELLPKAKAKSLLSRSQRAPQIASHNLLASDPVLTQIGKPSRMRLFHLVKHLSSTLLAEVLNQRGIAARQVDARRCIITNEEYTCAAPLMAETSRRLPERVASTSGRRTWFPFLAVSSQRLQAEQRRRSDAEVRITPPH